jgi:hypothetical protein
VNQILVKDKSWRDDLSGQVQALSRFFYSKQKAVVGRQSALNDPLGKLAGEAPVMLRSRRAQIPCPRSKSWIDGWIGDIHCLEAVGAKTDKSAFVRLIVTMFRKG